MGLIFWSIVDGGRISHRRPMSIIVVALLIVTSYWALGTAGLFGGADSSGTITPFGIDIPYPGIVSEPVELDELPPGYKDSGITDECIEDYLDKNYGNDSAQKLCRMRRKNG